MYVWLHCYTFKEKFGTTFEKLKNTRTPQMNIQFNKVELIMLGYLDTFGKIFLHLIYISYHISLVLEWKETPSEPLGLHGSSTSIKSKAPSISLLQPS